MWFEKGIDKKQAEDLFTEIEEYTLTTIINDAREMRDLWPFAGDIATVPFEPKGVVVHISRTPSLWNAFHLLSRHVYGSHFLIAAGRHRKDNLLGYPLLRDLPSAIFSPFKFDQLIQHSGYLSQHTFSIELRTVGMLRPHIADVPPPVHRNEETIEHFKSQEEEINLFTPFNQWRVPFLGKPYAYDDMYYELPTIQQVASLAVLMKALNVYTDGQFIDQLIVPSNCVHDMLPVLPCIPWDQLRTYVTSNTPFNHAGWMNHLAKRAHPSEYEDLEDENDGTLGEQLDFARWRGEKDIGELLTLFDYERQYSMAHGYKRYLAEMGHDVSTKEACNLAMQMYAIKKHLGQSRESDVYTALQMEYGMFI